MEYAQSYVEERRMSTKTRSALVVPFAIPICVLISLNILLPLPTIARIAIFGAAMLDASIGIVLLALLSRMRTTIDDSMLIIAFRILITSRTPLTRIVACAPTQWSGWGISYSLKGRKYTMVPGGNAVRLMLTNNAQLLFTSQHPAAVCDALHARRPEILIA